MAPWSVSYLKRNKAIKLDGKFSNPNRKSTQTRVPWPRGVVCGWTSVSPFCQQYHTELENRKSTETRMPWLRGVVRGECSMWTTWIRLVVNFRLSLSASVACYSSSCLNFEAGRMTDCVDPRLCFYSVSVSTQLVIAEFCIRESSW